MDIYLEISSESPRAMSSQESIGEKAL